MISGTRHALARGLSTFLTLIVTWAMASVALAALVGSRDQLDPVLIELIDPLHQQGIDVVAGDASRFDAPQRPRVAMLSGMPSAQPIDFKWREWMVSFESGANGVVAAVRQEGVGREATDGSSFMTMWREAPRDKRVFLSFTAADVDAARGVADALRQQGYVTFMFMNVRGQAPQFTAETTGTFFSQAGHYLVLDTTTARKSHGVWVEASLARLVTRPGGDGGDAGRAGGKPRPRPEEPSGGSGARTVVVDGFNHLEFLQGVRGKWIVTENPQLPGKLFVHRSQRGNALVDLLYRVQVEGDGTWTVYKPGGASAGRSLGIRQGQVTRPPDVTIYPCGCR